VYNVCSGRGLRIGDLLDLLIRISGREIEVRVDPQKVRKAEIPEVIGDRTKITAATGWEPDVPLERTLGYLLEGWRARAAAATPPAPPPQ
jgi:GDP-4-dehydro-6-deoxy-D-mannose reductase